MQEHPEISRIGYGGSYARGDWGVGSDIDVIIVVSAAEEPFTERALRYDAMELPVPADVLVYTEEEWIEIGGSGAFRPIVWIADG